MVWQVTSDENSRNIEWEANELYN